MKLDRGLVQVYTGEGKGKTTAALGQCLRAAGWGLRCCFIQFLKKEQTGERLFVERCKHSIELHQFGTGRFIKEKPTAEDLAEAERAVRLARRVVNEQLADLLVLDEVSHAVNLGLVAAESVVGLLHSRPAHLEVIMTGRAMPAVLLEQADLVTEMRAVRHPWEEGVGARQGIEY